MSNQETPRDDDHPVGTPEVGVDTEVSASMKELLAKLDDAAKARGPVIITGDLADVKRDLATVEPAPRD